MHPRLSKLLAAFTLAAGLIGSAAAVEQSIPPAPSLATGGNTPTPTVQGLRSILEPPSSNYHFSLTPAPQPTGWILLLGALLTGGFIARRRLGNR